jgi:hypothetical protein
MALAQAQFQAIQQQQQAQQTAAAIVTLQARAA